MVQVCWNALKDGAVLCSLFENGLADPQFTKAANIDPIKESRDEFEKFSKEQFRNNCKTTAVAWMSGKAVEGTRLRDRECWIDALDDAHLIRSHLTPSFFLLQLTKKYLHHPPCQQSKHL